MMLEDIVSGYFNVLIFLVDSQGKMVYYFFGVLDICEFMCDVIFDKDVQGGEVYFFFGLMMMMLGYGYGYMEHSNWWMINLLVGLLVDGKLIYMFYIVLLIDFYFYYINDLMNKFIMIVLVISILIVFIVLLVVYKGYVLICSVSC